MEMELQIYTQVFWQFISRIPLIPEFLFWRV